MSKLIYAPSLAVLKTTYPDWEQKSSSIYRSIGYTSDGYMYTHGKIFKMSVDGVDNPWGLQVSISNQDLSVTLDGYTSTAKLPIVDVIKQGTDINVTKESGVVTIQHADILSGPINLGPTSNSNTTISIPRLLISKTGHIQDTASFTATLNQVLQSESNSESTAFLLFGTQEGTYGTLFNKQLKADLTTGNIYANSFFEGNTSLAEKYAPILHSSSDTIYGVGNSSSYGHVKLSDSTSSNSNQESGVASTPKAVSDSLNEAKQFAKDLLGTTDAMLYVGTISGTGVIQSHNSAVISSGVVDGETNISKLPNYSAGWTFKVISDGTISSIGKVEIGDMLIATNNMSESYKASDWNVIQSNIDGAVTIAANLTPNTLTIATSATTIKSLTNGSVGQFLVIGDDGVPKWSSSSNVFRTIKYNNQELLSSTNSTPLNIVQGKGISISGNAAQGSLTIQNTGVLNTYALVINNSTSKVGEYQPKTASSTFIFKNGLDVTLEDSTFSIGHTSSSPVKDTGLWKFSVDSFGHVVAGEEVVALPNSAKFIIANNAGTSVDSYIGNVQKTLKFANTTDLNLQVTASNNIITVQPQLTHRYRGISIQPKNAESPTSVFSTTEAGTITLKAGSNFNISNNGGVLTLDATDTNTWRNVKAILAGTDVTTEVLSTSIGVADLEFGSDFLWTETGNNGKLQIGWAEIDEEGNVTYVI